MTIRLFPEARVARKGRVLGLAGASLLIGTALFAVQAHAIELTGVWASDAALCGKIFAKTGKQVAFGPLSDLYGSGFIIEGNRIRGKIARCTIKSRTEEGETVHLMAACSTQVAVENMQFSLRVIDADTVVRIYPGTTAMEVSFHRCAP